MKNVRSAGRAASDYLLQLAAMARANGLAVLADGGNSYTAPLAEGLYDVPATSSGYLFADRDVPLLQMALIGGRWLSGRPLNLAPDLRDAMLASVAIGMVPTIELTAVDPGRPAGHRLRPPGAVAGIRGARGRRGPRRPHRPRDLRAPRAGRWSAVAEPAAGVTVLSYEGGGEVVVNRSSAPFAWKGRTVAAGDLAGTAGGRIAVKSVGLTRLRIREGRLFVLPWVVGFVLFVAWPLGYSLFLSFQKVSPAGFRTTFVGIKNYAGRVRDRPPVRPVPARAACARCCSRRR